MNLTTLDRARLEEELLSDRIDQSPVDCAGTSAAAYAGGASALLRHRLAVARELLLREARSELVGGAPITSPAAARDYLRLHFATLTHEVFVVIFLDAQHRVLACEEMFRGTLTQTGVYPREVMREALAFNASAVLFAHNHPSRADELLTCTLKAALALIDVQVLDHLVCAGEEMTSLAERGLL